MAGGGRSEPSRGSLKTSLLCSHEPKVTLPSATGHMSDGGLVRVYGAEKFLSPGDVVTAVRWQNSGYSPCHVKV